MEFSEACAQPQKQVNALHLVEPLLQCRRQLIRGQFGTRQRARGSQRLGGFGSQPRERLVTKERHELKVLGHENRGRHAVARAQADLLGLFHVLIAVEEPDLNA